MASPEMTFPYSCGQLRQVLSSLTGYALPQQSLRSNYNSHKAETRLLCRKVTRSHMYFKYLTPISAFTPHFPIQHEILRTAIL